MDCRSPVVTLTKQGKYHMTSTNFRPIILTSGATIMKRCKVQIIITIVIVAMVASFTSSALAVDNRTDLLKVDAKNFSRPTIIDNKYMPLKPGTQTVYEGWTIE